MPRRPTNKFIVFTCHLRRVTCIVAKITCSRYGEVHKRHYTAAAEKLSKISDTQKYLSNKLQLLHIAAACMGQWILRSPSSCPSAPVIHCHCPSEGIDPFGISLCRDINVAQHENCSLRNLFWATTGFWQKSDWSFTFVRIVRCLNQAVFIQAILSTTLADLESMRTWKSNNRPMRCHFGRLDCNC